MLATVGGVATCAAVLVLFLGALGNADVSTQGPQGHFVRSFGGAIVFTLAALVTISNRDNNGWTWAKGRLLPTSENRPKKSSRITAKRADKGSAMRILIAGMLAV